MGNNSFRTVFSFFLKKPTRGHFKDNIITDLFKIIISMQIGNTSYVWNI